MDIDEVKACIRALLSSTAFSYQLSNLLNDFKNMTGFDLPLFGCLQPVEFLKTLNDTVKVLEIFHFGLPVLVPLYLPISSSHIRITFIRTEFPNKTLQSLEFVIRGFECRCLDYFINSPNNCQLALYCDPTGDRDVFKVPKEDLALFGNPCNPEIALVESKKSAHITSLVDRQKGNTFRTKNPHFTTRQRRLVLPDRNAVEAKLKEDEIISSESFSFRNFIKKSVSPPSVKSENLSFSSPRVSESKLTSHSPKTYMNIAPNQLKPPLEVKVNSSVLFKGNNYFNHISSSNPPSHGQKLQTRISPIESPEIEKTDSCYFEDVSDNESCVSIEDSRSSSGQAVSASCCFINDGIKSKLKKLIKNYPKGLWCCELPELFLEEFNFVLDYREFGYTSLIQMLSELPDVFRCVRPGNEDWILFDASVPPSSEEKKMMDLQLTGDINCEIRANVQKLLFNYLENSPDSSVEMDKILDLYQKMFGSRLDYQSLGFKDIKSLLETWEGSLLNLSKIDGKIFVLPASKISIHSPKTWKEAVPPITAENDIFAEIFPREVLGPDEKLLELDLTRHIAVGHVIEVCIAEVWSPSKFYLQLNKFKSRLNRFMDDLHRSGYPIFRRFYNIHLSKYKMPDSTIRPKQVCVGLYTSDPDFPDEWHRARIIKVINEKLVLINFVDFGTVTRVRKSQLRFLHRSFQSFPIQAFLAELSGVVPPNNEKKWPMSTSRKFLELLRVPYLDAEMVDIDFKKPSMSVILLDSSQKSAISINKKLVLEKLAWVKEPVFEENFLSEDESEAEVGCLRPTENQTAFNDGVTTEEDLNKNVSHLTDEFSDIADLSDTALFHFKMKCLKLEESLPSKGNNGSYKTPDDWKVLCEFEEVPDLEKNSEERKSNKTVEGKKNVQNDIFENKNMEPVPFFQDIIENSSFPSKYFIREKSNFKFRLPNAVPTVPEQMPLHLSGNSKRLPPGLEHVNILPNFNEIQLFMQPEDKKRRINILAMELLAKNLSVKQVGMNDPVLALKMATEMAEAYVSAEDASKMFCFNPHLATSFAEEIGENVNKGRKSVLPNVLCETMSELSETNNFITYQRDTTYSERNSPQDFSSEADVKINNTKEKKENEYVKDIQIGGKSLHLVIIDDKNYFCAEEIIRNFTLISNREIADRVLHIKKIFIDYRVLTKKTDEKALNAIKRSNLPTIKKKSKKLKIYLIPLAKVVPFLQALGCRTKSVENKFLELLQIQEKDINQKTELS